MQLELLDRQDEQLLDDEGILELELDDLQHDELHEEEEDRQHDELHEEEDSLELELDDLLELHDEEDEPPAAYSYAPMSHAAPCGLEIPSLSLENPVRVAPLSMSTLPLWRWKSFVRLVSSPE